MPISDDVRFCAQESIQRAVEEMANRDLSPARRCERAKVWASQASRMLALGVCPHTDPQLFKDLVL